MQQELITTRDDVVIRRLVLEPGEALPWHTDVCHRFTVVLSGDDLTIEFRESGERVRIPVRRGAAEWDKPEPRVHRAVNTGTVAYEEVVMFFLESPGITPQPPPADGFDAETRNGGERDHTRPPDL